MPVRRPLAVCLLLALGGPAAAQSEYSWSAGGGGDWGTVANWSVGGSPAAGLPGTADTVNFGSLPVAGGPHTVLLNTSRAVTSVFTGSSLGPASGAVTLSPGADPFSTLSLAAGGFLAATGADLTVTGTVQFGSGLTLNNGLGTLRVNRLVAPVQSGTPSLTVTSFGPAGVQLGAGGFQTGTIGQAVNVSVTGGSTLSLSASQTWNLFSAAVVNVFPVSSTSPTPAVDLGAAGQTLTVNIGGSNDGLGQLVFNGVGLTGAGGLTLAASTPALGNGPGAGYLFLNQGPSGSVVTATATGPLSITGGTLNIGGTGTWGGTDVRVSAGQLLFSSGSPAINAFPAGTNLQVTGSGAYNIGLPTGTGAITPGPRAHTQTYASVQYTGTGTFDTGAGPLTVSGTFTNRTAAAMTVNPGGTLTVNRLDLQDVVGAAGGTLTVRTDFSGGALVGTLSVGAGGLNIQNRTITLTTTAAAANFASYLKLTGGDVTAGGASRIQPGSAFNAVVNLRSTGGTATPPLAFDVASGGTLTVTATLANGDYVPGAASVAQSGFIKRGAGTMVLGGTNQFTGPTTVEAGRLVIGSAGAFPNSPGSLTLSGGTLSTAGIINEVGVSETIGRLYVASSSTLALGTGSHTLDIPVIAGSGNTAGLAPGAILTITGWAGPEFGPGTAGRIRVADNPGLDADSLSRIQFVGYPLGANRVFVSGFGFELVPVPEPTTVLAVAAAGLLLARRRILAG